MKESTGYVIKLIQLINIVNIVWHYCNDKLLLNNSKISLLLLKYFNTNKF